MRRYETPSMLKKPLTISKEMRDLIQRRTIPFMDSVGIHRPLSFIFEEIYLQGMKDAMAAMESIDATS